MTEEEVPLFASAEFRAPKPFGDSTVSFRMVVDEYEGGFLRTPDHQRDANAWSFAKKKEYIRRLCDAEDGRHPPGSFATYQLVERGIAISPEFLNDGLQRLSTLITLKNDPILFDMTADSMRNLLRQTISVQHRHYPSHIEAMRDFQLINNGTALTPYEHCAGFLYYMSDYERHWENLLDEIDKAVRASEARLRTKVGKTKEDRLQEHKRRRHTFALFHRFLTADRRHVGYPDVASKEVQAYVDIDMAVEQRLSAALVSIGQEEAQRQLRMFCKFIEDETAVLETLVRERLGAGAAFSPVTHRWLLDLAVWRRNNSKTRETHKAFVSKLLEGTRGQAQWIREREGKREAITLSLSHLGLLPRLAEWAEMPDFCQKQRRQKRPAVLPGYDNSHVEPFATHGDGVTVPEAAAFNRARGAQTLLIGDEGEPL